MKTKIHFVLAMLLVASSVAACTNDSAIFTEEKAAPDEFAVYQRAPLSLPPNYNLRPPSPGENRPQSVNPRDRARAALTELFQQARNEETPVMIERIVDDIDDIVRKVRFPEWQATNAGEREVRKALRRTLFKYKLHTDTELFEKAYGYVREYY